MRQHEKGFICSYSLPVFALRLGIVALWKGRQLKGAFLLLALKGWLISMQLDKARNTLLREKGRGKASKIFQEDATRQKRVAAWTITSPPRSTVGS